MTGNYCLDADLQIYADNTRVHTNSAKVAAAMQKNVGEHDILSGLIVTQIECKYY